MLRFLKGRRTSRIASAGDLLLTSFYSVHKCRFALAYNQLASLPSEFSGLSRLRYLNLRANSIKEFPVAVRTQNPDSQLLLLFSWKILVICEGLMSGLYSSLDCHHSGFSTLATIN